MRLRTLAVLTLLCTAPVPVFAQAERSRAMLPPVIQIGPNPTPSVITDTGVPINTLINVRFVPTSGAMRATPFFSFLQVPDAGAALPFYGAVHFVTVPSTVTGTTSAVRGAYNNATSSGGNTGAELTGTMSWAIHGGNGTQNAMSAVRGFAEKVNGSGTVSSMRAFHAEVYIDPGGSGLGNVTNGYGLLIQAVDSTGAGNGDFVNLYGTSFTYSGPPTTSMVGHYVGNLSAPIESKYVFWGEDTTAPVFTNAWLSGAYHSPIATKTANYVVNFQDGMLLCDATAGPVVFTLPTADSAHMDARGMTVTMKKIDASANACTLDGNGSETIDGGENVSTTTQWARFTVVTNGVAWFVK